MFEVATAVIKSRQTEHYSCNSDIFSQKIPPMQTVTSSAISFIIQLAINLSAGKYIQLSEFEKEWLHHEIGKICGYEFLIKSD